MDLSALPAWFSQLWPLVAILLVAGPLFMRGAKARREAVHRASAKQAASLGMAYTAPAQGGNLGVLDEGTHRFSGTTQGIEWQCEALLLAQTDSDTGTSTRRVDRLSHTRWTAPGCGTGGGTLMLMNPPAGTTPAAAATPGTGFLASIADKTAGMALTAFALACFGAERTRSLSLQPRHRLPAPADAFGRTFVIFSDEPQLLQRLDAGVRDALLQAKDEQVAMLWDVHGLTLNWPKPAVSPGEIADTAAFGVAIAAGLSRRGMLD